ENQIDVVALRAGVITSTMVEVGRAVKKGEVLATLDDRQLAAERDAAETQVVDADLRRAQAMRDAGINTVEELDHARYKVIGSQYEIEKAKQDLSTAQHNLRAL